MNSVTERRNRHERRARILGTAVALAAMFVATWVIEWPAPGVSLALGYVAYRFTRGRED